MRLFVLVFKLLLYILGCSILVNSKLFEGIIFCEFSFVCSWVACSFGATTLLSGTLKKGKRKEKKNQFGASLWFDWIKFMLLSSLTLASPAACVSQHGQLLIVHSQNGNGLPESSEVHQRKRGCRICVAVRC